jgi:inhibitor of cysteine peptidase
MATFTLTERDQASHLTIAPGDGVVVRLPENPTTGFRWQADSHPPSALLLVADEFSSPGGVPGAAGFRVLSFRATGPGPSTLRLKLGRQWEGEQSVTKRYEFRVEVKER